MLIERNCMFRHCRAERIYTSANVYMHQLYSRGCILYIQNSPSQNANFVSFPLYPNIFELASREILEINDDVEEGTSDAF